MAADLLPCPFCGGEADIGEAEGWTAIACFNGGCWGPKLTMSSREGAMRVWSRRAPPLAAPAPSAMATGEDVRMGARPSWETMHTPMGPSGGGSWDDARRRWAAEASARATPPAAPAAVTEAQRENAVRAVRIQFGERSVSPEEVVDMVIAALASASPTDER